MSEFTYRRRNIRLRFEPGQRIPERGEAWEGVRALSGRPIIVRILKVKHVFQHEDGATLMDAQVSIRDIV